MVEKVPKKHHSLDAYSLTFSGLSCRMLLQTCERIKKTISPLKMLKVWAGLFKSGLRYPRVSVKF